MRPTVIIIMMLIASTKLTAQDTGCLQYHTGRFVYMDSTGRVTYIRRTKRYETEYLTENDVWVSSRIKWTGDCSYELYQLSSNSKEQRKNNHTTRKIVIAKPMSDGYEYSCGCEETGKIIGSVKIAKF